MWASLLCCAGSPAVRSKAKIILPRKLPLAAWAPTNPPLEVHSASIGYRYASRECKASCFRGFGNGSQMQRKGAIARQEPHRVESSQSARDLRHSALGSAKRYTGAYFSQVFRRHPVFGGTTIDVARTIGATMGAACRYHSDHDFTSIRWPAQ